MLATVLSSKVAIQASVRVVRAFVRLREMVAANTELAAKLKDLERRLDSHDEAIVELFAVLKQMLAPEAKAKRQIGFHVRERTPRYRTKKRF
jgi:acyl-coenzyme A synthetase/AMP-(fatty) acid ligase